MPNLGRHREELADVTAPDLEFRSATEFFHVVGDGFPFYMQHKMLRVLNAMVQFQTCLLYTSRCV